MFHLRSRLVRQALAFFAVLVTSVAIVGPTFDSHVAYVET